MKKVILSAAVAVLGLVGANAQVGMESVELGARAGYNHTIVGGDAVDTYNIEGNSGFHVGLFAEVPVTDKFSIQPEVLYSTQSANADIVGTEIKLKSQNINIPVLAKFYVADGFNIQVGPQLGIHTGNDSDLDSIPSVSDKDVDEMFNSVNFSGVVGVGYKLPQGLSIDARYNYSFSNVLDEENTLVESLPNLDDYKNSVFSIGLGYSF